MKTCWPSLICLLLIGTSGCSRWPQAEFVGGAPICEVVSNQEMDDDEQLGGVSAVDRAAVLQELWADSVVVPLYGPSNDAVEFSVASLEIVDVRRVERSAMDDICISGELGVAQVLVTLQGDDLWTEEPIEGELVWRGRTLDETWFSMRGVTQASNRVLDFAAQEYAQGGNTADEPMCEDDPAGQMSMVVARSGFLVDPVSEPAFMVIEDACIGAVLGREE